MVTVLIVCVRYQQQLVVLFLEESALPQRKIAKSREASDTFQFITLPSLMVKTNASTEVPCPTERSLQWTRGSA
jgi:hypothetical protein